MSKKNHNILFHFPQQIISNQIKTKQQKTVFALKKAGEYKRQIRQHRSFKAKNNTFMYSGVSLSLNRSLTTVNLKSAHRAKHVSHICPPFINLPSAVKAGPK